MVHYFFIFEKGGVPFLSSKIEKAEINLKRQIKKQNNTPTIEQMVIYLNIAKQYIAENEENKPHAYEISKYVKEMALWLSEGGTKTEYIKLYWTAVLFETPYLFRSFIEYMEKNRQPEKKFFEPRKETLNIVVDDLQQLEEGKLKFYGLSMPSRVGKLISDETPVLTKDGWKKHGDLCVGDYVTGLNGEYVKVTHIFDKNVANKRVWFADHTYIDCHENHEWVVYDRAGHKTRIVETKNLANSEYYEKGNKRYRFFLPLVEPVKGNKQNLPAQPYTFGAWLGDGTNKKPRITICDTDKSILESIENEGYKCIHAYKQQGCCAYEFSDLKTDLHKIGLCQRSVVTEKYIPDIYFTASIEQRLELLAGLLDTDGTLKQGENRYSFSTVSERLRDDFVSLVSTFGWRCSVVEYAPKMSSSGIQGRHKVYCIGFNPTFEIPCRVKRKQLKTFSKQKRISIQKVEDIEPKSGNCISVEGGIYRVGKRCIPTHNSTICIFFLAWVMLRRPNSHNAMGGHSGILAKGFYKELLNLITTPEYTFGEIYKYVHPEYANARDIVTDKSSDEFTITLGDPDRFATVTCRGIDGTWTGAVDVSKDGYLYVDDLIRDRQHSLSPIRMEDTFQEYLNKMVDRKNDGAKELMVGTLWNVMDPLERIRKQYEDNPLYRFRKIPALDENDESNFNYKINGFSTEYYRNMRERLDNAEWQAKFMQQPYVREGLLFPLDELRYFNGVLPDGDYRIVAVVDVAWGGGDSLSMPIGAEYENGDVYIFDWVFSQGAKEVTLPIVTGKIIGNEIRQIRFEANTGGELYCEYIDEKLREQGYKCSCTHKKAPNNLEKVSKIIAYSGDIKRKFIFLSPKTVSEQQKQDDAILGIKRFYPSKEYKKALEEVGTFVTIGKNPHDDAVDSLAQLQMFIDDKFGILATIDVFDRPF